MNFFGYASFFIWIHHTHSYSSSQTAFLGACHSHTFIQGSASVKLLTSLVQCLAQGQFHMWTGGAMNWTTDRLINHPLYPLSHVIMPSHALYKDNNWIMYVCLISSIKYQHVFYVIRLLYPDVESLEWMQCQMCKGWLHKDCAGKCYKYLNNDSFNCGCTDMNDRPSYY